MKIVMTNFIGEWIEELQDGFNNGIEDVVVFFRENLKIILEIAGGPEMGAMMSGMGIEPVMTFVQNAYRKHRENKFRDSDAA